MDDAFELEGAFWVLSKRLGVPAYDFDFRRFMNCRRPWEGPRDALTVARVGAFEDYPRQYQELQEQGFRLVNSPEEHVRASELPGWYPFIEDLTPRSRCYEERPSASDLLSDFELPVFIKGSRQTDRHSAELSVARTKTELEAVLEAYHENAVLHWQSLVCREFVDLQPVEGDSGGKLRASFEFRSFWWRGELVGAGHYWSEFVDYDWSESQRRAALRVARQAVERLSVPFLVVDLALTAAGRWIVIECNDAQESGYAGVSPFSLWSSVVAMGA